jgi:phosphoglycerol transferase
MLKSLHQFYQGRRHTIRGWIRFITYLFAFFLVATAYWVADNFGEPSLEQVFYHAQFGMEGLVDTDTAIVKSFLKWCLLLPLLLASFLVLLELAIAQHLIHGKKKGLARPVQFLNTRFLKFIYWMIDRRAPLYVLILAMGYFSVQFSVTTYVHNKFGKDYFSKHYVYPAKVSISLKNPKNLVLIYVESLEDSYQDSHLFGKDLLQSLDHVKGVSFAHYRQAPGTGWTIAGITATQCGLPLKSVSLYDGNDQGQNIHAFLPSAVCLGDILHDHGYYNVYLGGDALAFSGKGRFFIDHHYDEVLGREELKGHRQPSELNFWGLYDDDLFDIVRNKLDTLHAKHTPFNLVFTTIDTHGPDGHYSRYCKSHGIKNFPGIVECTSNQVTEFLQYMRQKGYFQDTRVVILGDHLAMENPVYDKLETVKERYIFNRFISSYPITKNREDVLHFDMFPSILEFIGFKVEGGKLGLGFSAISKEAELPPETEYTDMQEDLLNQSDAYLALWKNRQ